MNIENRDNTQNIAGEKESIIVYFSWGGNNRFVSKYIEVLTGADIFEIITVNAYPKEYRATTEQAGRELNSNYLPEIKTKIIDLSIYKNIILVYPNWWGTIPQAVKTFLVSNNLSDKIIAPLCTHEGSRMGNSVSDIKKCAPNSTITEGLAVRGNSIKSSQNEISQWLNKIGVLEK